AVDHLRCAVDLPGEESRVPGTETCQAFAGWHAGLAALGPYQAGSRPFDSVLQRVPRVEEIRRHAHPRRIRARRGVAHTIVPTRYAAGDGPRVCYSRAQRGRPVLHGRRIAWHLVVPGIRRAVAER